MTRGLPKELTDFVHTRLVKHTSSVVAPSTVFYTLVKWVDAGDINVEKICTLDVPLEVNLLKMKTKNLSFLSRSTVFKPKMMATFFQNDPKDESKKQFLKKRTRYDKSNQSSH